jgi:hypothetical protein
MAGLNGSLPSPSTCSLSWCERYGTARARSGTALSRKRPAATPANLVRELRDALSAGRTAPNCETGSRRAGVSGPLCWCSNPERLRSGPRSDERVMYTTTARPVRRSRRQGARGLLIHTIRTLAALARRAVSFARHLGDGRLDQAAPLHGGPVAGVSFHCRQPNVGAGRRGHPLSDERPANYGPSCFGRDAWWRSHAGRHLVGFVELRLTAPPAPMSRDVPRLSGRNHDDGRPEPLCLG